MKYAGIGKVLNDFSSWWKAQFWKKTNNSHNLSESFQYNQHRSQVLHRVLACELQCTKSVLWTTLLCVWPWKFLNTIYEGQLVNTHTKAISKHSIKKVIHFMYSHFWLKDSYAEEFLFMPSKLESVCGRHRLTQSSQTSLPRGQIM
jgi:hypothetical protein